MTRLLAFLAFVTLAIFPFAAEAIGCIRPTVGPYHPDRLLPRLAAGANVLSVMLSVAVLAVIAVYAARRFCGRKDEPQVFLGMGLYLTLLVAFFVNYVPRCCLRSTGGYCIADHPWWMGEAEVFLLWALYCVAGYALFKAVTRLPQKLRLPATFAVAAGLSALVLRPFV